MKSFFRANHAISPPALFMISLLLLSMTLGGLFNAQSHHFALAATDDFDDYSDDDNADDQTEYDLEEDEDDSNNSNSGTNIPHEDSTQSKNDVAVTDENSIVTINVLANDMTTMNAQFISINNISKMPAFGRAAANSDGTITYVPYQLKLPRDSIFVDSFKYTAVLTSINGSQHIDNNSYEASVTVTIHQKNDAPIAYDMHFDIQKNSQLSFNLEGHDEEGDKITFIIVSNASEGWMTFDSSTGKVIYTHYDNTDDDEIKYVASDGITNSLPATITISTLDDLQEGEDLDTDTDHGTNTGSDTDNETPSDQEPEPDPDPCSLEGSNCNNGEESEGNPDDSGGNDSGTNSTSGSEQHPPTADAGNSITSFSGENTILDGTGSSDYDGDMLSYQWSQTSGPTVSLNNAQTSKPSFVAPSVSDISELEFELIVNDGHSDSDPSSVEVIVVPRPDIAIDVMPGIEPNVIYKNKPNDLVSVAILGSPTLSVEDIDDYSVRFGPGSASARSIEYIDVDADGFEDFVASFRIGDASLGSSTSACIVAAVYDDSTEEDVAFKACDSVTVTNSPKL